MKTLTCNRFHVFLLMAAFSLLQGCSSLPKHAYQIGLASWYGKKFHGRTTASGTAYNMNAMTAAHKTLKFGTRVKVVDPTNGRSVTVTINDRGPYSGKRIIDLSKSAAKKLGILERGTAQVVLYLQ